MHRAYVVRIALFLATGIVLWTSLLVRQLYTIQIERHSELSHKARRLCSYSISEQGRRGSILDRNGQLLASDVIYFNVSAYKPKFTKYKNKKGKYVKVSHEELIHDFNLVFNTPKEDLRRRFAVATQMQIVIAKEVEVSLVEMIKSDQFENLPIASLLKHPKLLKRLDFEKSYRRFYPNDKLLAHVIGYQSFDDDLHQNVGRIGIEKAWNRELCPKKKGKISYLRGAQGNIIQFSEVSRTEPEHGSNIYLTIREQIQSIIEIELKKMVEEHSPKVAYIMMANPKTGAILGMAQYPSFNLNDRSTVKPEQMKNRMLLDYFDPGSTMKGVSIALALDAGVVRLDNVFDCEDGFWYYGGKRLKDSHRYDYLTVSEVVQKSSNIGTAKIAMDLGKPRLYAGLRRFGFGQRPNVGLGPEEPGILRRPSNWYKVSITRIPMGQGISVTAMQMLQAYCALANDGVMMKLHAVDRVEDPNSDKVTVFQPQVKRRVISSKATKDIVSALSLVTKPGGTALRADIDGMNVAGKTGTSQKVVNGTYSNSKYVASFIGFVPAEDPEFVLMVVADEPKGSHYGGVVAAPTFKNISVQTLKYLQTDPLEK